MNGVKVLARSGLRRRNRGVGDDIAGARIATAEGPHQRDLVDLVGGIARRGGLAGSDLAKWSLKVSEDTTDPSTTPVRRDQLALVDEDWLRRHSPELATQTGRRAELGEALSAAHEHYRGELRAHGIDPAEFDGGEVAQLAVGSLALWILWREIAGDHARELAAQHREQATTWLRHLRIGAPPRDAVETDARTDTRRSPRVRGMSLRM